MGPSNVSQTPFGLVLLTRRSWPVETAKLPSSKLLCMNPETNLAFNSPMVVTQL
jgi:hypothetical protein